MPEALVLVANGSEEIEAITPGDVLVRAGVAVTYAGLGGTSLRGSRGLPLAADVDLAEVRGRLFDAVVLPGGAKGAANLAASPEVAEIVHTHRDAGRIVAAICAAPAVVLAPLGVLDGRRATCYPGLEANFSGRTAHATGDVVIDGPVVTSRGPGTAMAFALDLAALLAGGEAAERVRLELLLEP